MIPANDSRRDDASWAAEAERAGSGDLAKVLRPFPAERMLRVLGPVDEDDGA